MSFENTLNIEKICRTCLSEEANMRSVFSIDESSGDNLRLHEMLMSCASVQVIEDDGLPTQVCLQCTHDIIRFFSFKQVCERSDSTLRQILEQPTETYLELKPYTDNLGDFESTEQKDCLEVEPKFECVDIDLPNAHGGAEEEIPETLIKSEHELSELNSGGSSNFSSDENSAFIETKSLEIPLVENKVYDQDYSSSHELLELYSGGSSNYCSDESTSFIPTNTIETAEVEHNIYNEDDNSTHSSIPPDSTESTRKFRRQGPRRKHSCNFCDKLVGNYARHLQRQHKDEPAVQEFLSMEKNSVTRKKLIDKLRRMGDFSTSNIVPVKKVKKSINSDYIVCKFCHGYYFRRTLYRHAKKCFFNPNPSQRCKVLMEGQTLMSGDFDEDDILQTSGILNMMRADEISLIAKRDPIICEVGREYMRTHKDKHLLIIAKRNMRCLARLLLTMRRLTFIGNLRMIDILVPSKFKLLLKATREMAVYDAKTGTFNSPSLISQMGLLIRNAINAAYSLEGDKFDLESEHFGNLTALMKLMETFWVNGLLSETGQNTLNVKYYKPGLIPLAEDATRFEKYLKELIQETKTKLVQDSNDNISFQKLQEAILCCILIFNKASIEDLQCMTLTSYFKSCYAALPPSEFQESLTESEKILLNTLKCVVIRGKSGLYIPLLLEVKTIESIDFAINLRNNFNLSSNPYVLGVPNTNDPIHADEILRKHAKLVLGSDRRVSFLTSSKLRTQLATILQIKSMNRNELKQLATFMGHSEDTEEEFYSIPDDVHQIVKITKLILYAKHNSIQHFQGRSLAHIDVNNIPDFEDSSGICYIDLENGIQRIQTQKNASCAPSTKGSKRILVPWTREQKRYAEKFFEKHIEYRKAPKKQEVLKLIGKYPTIFENKNWKLIKVFIHNQFNKKTYL